MKVVLGLVAALLLAAPAQAYARLGHTDVERSRGTVPGAAAPSTEGTALSISAAAAASLNRRVRHELAAPAKAQGATSIGESHAAGPDVSVAGHTLTRPSAAYRAEQVRRVWIWADYWACVLRPDGNTVAPECSWVPSHYQTVPDSATCEGVFLGGDPNYRVTVCR